VLQTVQYIVNMRTFEHIFPLLLNNLLKYSKTPMHVFHFQVNDRQHFQKTIICYRYTLLIFNLATYLTKVLINEK